MASCTRRSGSRTVHIADVLQLLCSPECSVKQDVRTIGPSIARITSIALIVAGSLSSALLGGVEGAVAGAAFSGMLGWLSALGISKQHILKYEESVKAGKTLVVAHGTADEVKKAESILTATSPADLKLHVQAA